MAVAVEIRPPAGGDDGDNGGEKRQSFIATSPSPKRYSTAITIARLHIDVFLALPSLSSYYARRDVGVTVASAAIFLRNTVLLASSFTLGSRARRLTLLTRRQKFGCSRPARDLIVA